MTRILNLIGLISLCLTVLLFLWELPFSFAWNYQCIEQHNLPRLCVRLDVGAVLDAIHRFCAHYP